MRSKKLLFVFGVLLLAVTITYTACRKADRDEDTDTQSATDNMAVEAVYNDALSEIIDAAFMSTELTAKQGHGSFHDRLFDTCGIVTITPAPPTTGFPKTVTIDYGSGCTDNYGITRKGKIISTFSGKLKGAGTSIVISFSNYYYNGIMVEGTYTIYNKGKNSSAHWVYAINGSNLYATTGAGKVTCSFSRTREWLTGDTTATKNDDSFGITGTSSGTGVKGVSYTSTINSALNVAYGCGYIKSGKITITPGSLSPRVIDFGDGTCDNKATLTFNGKSQDITLP